MAHVIEGIVRDGKIELVGGPELADGQRVQVVIEPQAAPGGPTSEEGTIHTPLDDPALIDLLAHVRRDHAPLPPSPSGPGRRSAAGMLADDPTWDKHLRDVLDARKSAVYREFPE